jgi:predicted NBD/HSP70 family sugar kinase
MIANLKRIVALLMARDEGKKVVGIGVVAPGPLDDRKGVILSPQNFYGWSNIPIGDILKESVHLPVFLDNNANAYALAEKNYGKGRNYHSFLHMVIDEGIGTGIIVNDKIYKGKGGFGSETGHISIQMDGPKCECGSNGCLEVYATIPRIMDALNTSAELGVPSEFLSGIIKNRPLEWEDIIEGLNRKDAVCINILKKEASYLGCALVNLINVLEPEAVILGSKIAQAGSFITVPLREYVEERTVTREFQKPDIFVSNLAKASLLGGATIVLNHFIEGTMGEYEEILKSVG